MYGRYTVLDKNAVIVGNENACMGVEYKIENMSAANGMRHRKAEEPGADRGGGS